MFELERLGALKVLVAGDVMLDRYWSGDVRRISPEAPVPVVSVNTVEERLGGAANVACNVAALGAHCVLAGIIGDDDAGARLVALAEKHGLSPRLEKATGLATTVKLRVLGQHQQLIRLDFEGQPDVAAQQRLQESVESDLDDFDALILSDYDKGSLAGAERLVAAARERGKPVMVDPKGDDFSRYRGADMLTPNLREFVQQAGACPDESRLDQRAASVISELQLQRLLITRGEEGMTLYFADGRKLHGPARAREVFDVTGAGDTTIAAMCLLMAAGADPGDALHIANAAAGVVIAKLGTATATPAEIHAALQAGA
ncbi:MAG: D-glycero-beta-D-manno-heptose-7-phosphate kinase [Gammaproteobacteria bacterium]|jgi:rfaE bifunctional protein kinase chain/domain|nr:D-glycero-beta-D-manno-heptose-7-phosphate kinase [Gammaproteobacteria bacterium]